MSAWLLVLVSAKIIDRMSYWEEKILYSMVVSRCVETCVTRSTNDGKSAEINALRLIMMVMIIQFSSSFINVLV
jgi:hypothetical protein